MHPATHSQILWSSDLNDFEKSYLQVIFLNPKVKYER